MAFSTKHTVLAALGRGDAGRRGNRASDAHLDAGDCTTCLCRCAGGVELGGTNHAHRRDLSTSQPDKTARCRQALEELIALTCPARAPELAQRLVDRFGSFAATLSARRQDRMRLLDGALCVERTFECLQMSIQHILCGKLAGKSILSNEQALMDYLRATMAFAPVEQLRVLFLNAVNEILADEVLATGTISHVHAYPREIMKRCVEIGATAIFLIHNHPSGQPQPSRADRAFTRKIVDAARCLDVAVHDHLVIARAGHVSFRQAGYL